MQRPLDEIFQNRLRPDEIATGEIEQWLDISRMTINNWRNDGLLEPCRMIKRYGNIYRLDDVRLLAQARGYDTP